MRRTNTKLNFDKIKISNSRQKIGTELFSAQGQTTVSNMHGSNKQQCPTCTAATNNSSSNNNSSRNGGSPGSRLKALERTK
jgi:hypothetical protein